MFDRNFEQIQTNGITLKTVVEGEGPLVVLLHGFPQSSFLWRHQIDAIVEAGFKVAVPNQRGYEGSDAPAEINAYNVRELANDVAGIAPALGYDDFIVIGHDWGSLVALHTALLHEDTCTAVMGCSVPYTRAESVDAFINPPGASTISSGTYVTSRNPASLRPRWSATFARPCSPPTTPSPVIRHPVPGWPS